MRERDLQGHFTQEDATGLETGESAPQRILEHEQGEDPDDSEQLETPPAGEATDDTAEGAAEPPDVQLTRAIEVLKSWTYFEELQRLREDAGPEADAQAVAAVSNEDEGSP
jgi:hypothetical protein